MKTSFPLVLMSVLACVSCDSGRQVMLAPPAEPPEEIIVPPAVVTVGTTPSLAPALDVTPETLSSEATEVTIESDEPGTEAGTPGPSGAGLFHVCRASDTIEAIATRHGVDPVRLMRVNGLSSGNGLRGGMVLLLPRALDDVSMAPDVTTYTVVAGDNYSRIARNYQVTAAALMQLNGAESSALQVGDVLYVPNPQR